MARRPAPPLFRRRTLVAWFATAAVIAVVVGLLLGVLAAELGLDRFFMIIIGFLAGLPVLAVFHDTAHLVVGALVGRRPVAARFLGTWRVWVRVRPGRSVVHLGRNLCGGGAVLSNPSRRRGRWLRDVAEIGAGPASDVAMGAFAWWLAGWCTGVAAGLALGLAVAATISAFFNLVPRATSTPIRRIPSDGLLLRRLVATGHARGSLEAETALVELTRLTWEGDATGLVAAAHRSVGDGQGPEVLTAAAIVLGSTGDHEVARSALLLAVDHPLFGGWRASERLEAWNHLAWTDLVLGHDHLLEEAEHYARSAVAAKRCPATEDTWAWVCLRRGSFADAHAFFSRALVKELLPVNRAVAATGLGHVAAAFGDAELAAAWRAVADRYADGQQLSTPPVATSAGGCGASWQRTRLDRSAVAWAARHGPAPIDQVTPPAPPAGADVVPSA